jgi:general transcription factor 3C polypeptide 5 (transcription factor C subunit 1)
MRPDDILAKGIQSRPVKTDNVLLRVTVPRRTGRKRKKGSNEPYTKAPDWNPKAPFPVDGKELLRILQDNPDKHTITAIGNITGTHRFRQLPDYQWTTSSDSMMENLRETILSGDFNKLKKFKLDPSQQLAPGVELGAPPKFGFTKTPIPYM